MRERGRGDGDNRKRKSGAEGEGKSEAAKQKGESASNDRAIYKAQRTYTHTHTEENTANNVKGMSQPNHPHKKGTVGLDVERNTSLFLLVNLTPHSEAVSQRTIPFSLCVCADCFPFLSFSIVQR